MLSSTETVLAPLLCNTPTAVACRVGLARLPSLATPPGSAACAGGLRDFEVRSSARSDLRQRSNPVDAKPTTHNPVPSNVTQNSFGIFESPGYQRCDHVKGMDEMPERADSGLPV